MATIAIEIDKDKLRDFCRRWKITELARFVPGLRDERGAYRSGIE